MLNTKLSSTFGNQFAQIVLLKTREIQLKLLFIMSLWRRSFCIRWTSKVAAENCICRDSSMSSITFALIKLNGSRGKREKIAAAVFDANFVSQGNDESCLSILNNFYNDGIKWHDVACHHVKPFVCEDSDELLNFVRSRNPGLRLWEFPSLTTRLLVF